MAQLARDLHRMGPAGRRRLRTEMERAGQSALSDARSRAGQWSRRIPASLSLRSDMREDRFGVQLRASASAAPHARPFEGIGTGGQFRHPVYGHRDRWISQATRPFMWPAVAGRREQITQSVAAAYEQAARECGFR